MLPVCFTGISIGIAPGRITKLVHIRFQMCIYATLESAVFNVFGDELATSPELDEFALCPIQYQSPARPVWL